jgi:hypothetical protein
MNITQVELIYNATAGIIMYSINQKFMIPNLSRTATKILRFLPFFLVFFWLIITIRLSVNSPYAPPGDDQRELAIINNIQNGNFTHDALYLGYRAWYPSLFHYYAAVLSKLFHFSAQQIFTRYTYIVSLPTVLITAFVFNVMFPPAIAFTALALFLFVIPWTTFLYALFTHPLTMAIGLFYLTFFCYWKSVTTKKILWSLLSGIAFGLVILEHPVTSIVTGLTISIYEVTQRRSWFHFLITMLTAFLISAPYTLPLIFIYHLKVQNTSGVVNLGTFGNLEAELPHLLFGYDFSRYLILFFLFTGLSVSLIKKTPLGRLALTAFITSITIMFASVAQVLKYIPQIIPFSVPNEFQGYYQASGLILIAIGLNFWTIKIAEILPKFRKVIFYLFPLFMICVVVLISFPDIVMRYESASRQLTSNNYGGWADVAKWINSHTRINDVFLVSQDRAHFVIGGLTGRKVVATLYGFANAFVDQKSRDEDSNRMYQTSDIKLFMEKAAIYNVKYVIVSDFEAYAVPQADFTKFKNQTHFRTVFNQKGIIIYQVIN